MHRLYPVHFLFIGQIGDLVDMQNVEPHDSAGALGVAGFNKMYNFAVILQ